MTHTVLRGNAVMERKKVSISAKRQITIPQKFFAMLGFDDEAECILRGNELVIRPVKESSGGEFAEQILTDLVKRGLSGDELIKSSRKRFVRRWKKCLRKLKMQQTETPSI